MKKILLCSLLQFSVLSYANNLELESSENQTQIVELFTSEGCSSCPPADRWFSSLKSQPGLWQDFIPLAYHVDYWDYIGWKDKYASHENSMRQRQHRLAGNIGSVYTPGVVRIGKEWRSWRGQNIKKSDAIVGKLKVAVKDNVLTGSFNSKNNMNQYLLKVALVAMDIESKVKAGENIGKKLKHDFIVLKHHSYSVNKTSFQASLDTDFFQSDHKNLAFVAWVESDLVPIQAVGGLL